MTTDLLSLRDYQHDAIDAIEAAWNRGIRRPAAVLPTGAGKTVVFAHLIRGFLDRMRAAGDHDGRVLVLAHTDELVTQAARKIKQVAPHLPVGIVKAERNEAWARVIVASVQSLRTEKRRNSIRNVRLVIVDECHHATAKTYRDILTHVGAFDPSSDVRTVGFTATLARSDRAALNTVWQEAVYNKDILFMIEKGFLLDVRGVAVEVPDLDLDAVKRSRGDFQDGDLGRAMSESLAPELVAKAYLEHASDRSGLAFWPTVAAAEIGAEAMNAAGVTTEVVHGGLKDEDTYDAQGNLIAGRRSILRRFMAGDTQVISNCMVLTEGFDAPLASAVVVARPTKSKPLYQQIVGRVLRPHPGQTQALILDVCGTSAGNDLRSLIDLTDKPLTKVRDGQSLVEAVQEAEAAANEIVTPYRGPVVFAEFDPLARASSRAWMTTAGGTRFLTCGTDRYVFLVPATPYEEMEVQVHAGQHVEIFTQTTPEPDTWDVAWCTKSHPVRTADGILRHGGFTEHRGLDLGYAMKWAEDLVHDQAGESDFGYRKADWRRRAASEKQRTYATRLGCAVPEKATGGDVSVLIDTALASPRIDFFVGKILGGVPK